MKNSRKKLAVFDIDGTIFRSSLLIELVEALVADGVFPAKARKIYASAYKRWLDRKGDYEKYIDKVLAAFLKYIRGVAHEDFLRVARKVMAFHKNRVYRFTRDLVKNLKKRRRYLLAISNSPKEIVGEFCKNLGFNKVYGRVYEIDSRGKFTGKILYLDLISDKAKILQRVVEKENLTLKNSIGVGDTESDVPFLKMVSRPICFNPNQKLYQYAKRFGWEIVVERKDVIYPVRSFRS
jgi:HAD superfamily hydrolase (TIGR01490 family)